MDAQQMEAIYRLEHHMANALVSGTGDIESRMDAALKDAPYPPVELPVGDSVLPELYDLQLPGDLLGKLATLGAEHVSRGDAPVTASPDDVVATLKKQVSHLIDVDLTKVEVLWLDAEHWGDSGMPEALVVPRGEDTPLVAIPKLGAGLDIVLCQALTRAGHIMGRRADSDPSKAIADISSETFVEYAVLIRHLMTHHDEGAFAAAMLPVVTGATALAMQVYTQETGEWPDGAETLLSSGAGAHLGDIDHGHLDATIKMLAAGGEDALLEALKHMQGVVLALGLSPWSEYLPEYISSDSSNEPFSERVSTAFRDNAHEQVGLAEGILRLRLRQLEDG